MTRHLWIFAFALVLLSCQKAPMESGIDLTMMDTSVRPQDDFYSYMNGTWLKTFEIPADKSNYGSFTKVFDETEKDLLAIIEEAAGTPHKGSRSDIQKVGDMYLSFMDSTRAEELGMSPIQEDLAAVERVQSKDELVKLAASMEKAGVPNTFILFIAQDSKDATQYIVNFYQGGLGLPDRDYYLLDNDKLREVRSKYLTHMETMFTLAGMDGAARKAKQIMSIEEKLATHHWTRVENRDRNKTYNKFALADLDASMPAFNLQVFATESGFGSIDSLRVYQPSYFTAFNDVFASVSLAEWKTYLTWKVLTRWAPYLKSELVDEDFAFFRQTLRGIEENRPRWKRGVSAVEGTLAEVLGRIYVERHFRPEAKERMVTLVDNLQGAFGERIKTLDWMGDATKEKALEKLSKFKAKIGYPDKWKDYSKLEIKADDLVGNLKRSRIMEHERELAKLGKPVDRDEWLMTPQTVNAGYVPNMNEVIFPAAILQTPFFNMEADDAVNYGAIGAAIGHEMTHGFDDQGRKSDGDGNLTDWWTEEDAAEFEKRAEVLVEQFNKYNPVDTFHVNGRLTLGENIADLGGLTISYLAYKKSLDGEEAPVIDGFTGDQRFFLGWAQVWARKYRDETLRERLLTDPHSPSIYRVVGIVSNMPEFYAGFDVKETDPMYRDESIRARVW
ncbi:MAG: M13-type metalloendopeptidase [Bacteroidota bacterium]